MRTAGSESILANFIMHNGGIDAVVKLLHALNDGRKQQDIARELGTDPGRLSKLIGGMFVQRWSLRPDLAEALRHWIRISHVTTAQILQDAEDPSDGLPIEANEGQTERPAPARRISARAAKRLRA